MFQIGSQLVFQHFITFYQTTDAALLPVLSWPCFALHDAQQNKAAIKEIIETLKGRHGFKRFLRDGYGTALEDKNRLYYNASEIKVKL